MEIPVKLRPVALIALALASATILAGCSFSASGGDAGTDDGTVTEETTDDTATDDSADETAEDATDALVVPVGDFADVVAQYYADAIGTDVTTDCGQDDIQLIENSEVTCQVDDDVAGESYVSVSTISQITEDGAYHLDITSDGVPLE